MRKVRKANSPSCIVGQSYQSFKPIPRRSKYIRNVWHIHGLISVGLSIDAFCKLQYCENCCGAIWSNGLNEMFKNTKSGRMPKSGTVDKRQLAKLKLFNGAMTGFSKSWNEHLKNQTKNTNYIFMNFHKFFLHPK